MMNAQHLLARGMTFDQLRDPVAFAAAAPPPMTVLAESRVTHHGLARPGDKLRLECEMTLRRREICCFRVAAHVGDALIAEGSMILAVPTYTTAPATGPVTFRASRELFLKGNVSHDVKPRPENPARQQAALPHHVRGSGILGLAGVHPGDCCSACSTTPLARSTTRAHRSGSPPRTRPTLTSPTRSPKPTSTVCHRAGRRTRG